MNTTLIFTGLLFGSAGMKYAVYGRKQANIVALLAGVGVCDFSYFTTNAWMPIAISEGLVLLPFVIRL